MDFNPATNNGGMRPKLISKRAAKVKTWQALAVLGIVIVIIIMATASTPNPVNQAVIQVTGTQTSVSTGVNGNICSSSLPLSITVRDGPGGAVINTPTVTIDQGSPPTQLESGAGSSSGVYSAGTYTTGTSLDIKTSGASTVTQWIGGQNNVAFQVPGITCGSNVSTNNFNVYTVTLGAWTISVQGQGGTTPSSGKTLYFSQFPGGSTGTETFTVTFSETTANAGYKTSYDPVNLQYNYMLMEIKDTGSTLSVTGMPRQVNVGTTRYWNAIMADGITGVGYATTSAGAYAVTQSGNAYQSIGKSDSICSGVLSQQKVGNTVYGGSVSCSFGVSKGSLASGSSETLNIGAWTYADPATFALQTNYGPNAAQVGAPQGSSSGTYFQIILVNG